MLERWLSGSMFAGSAQGGSELDAVTASVKEHGMEETRRKWEEHWRGFVNEGDWEFLVKEGRGTSIRLPVGWWMMGDVREMCKGSEWEGLEGVYEGAWVSKCLLFFLSVKFLGDTFGYSLSWEGKGY